MIDEVSQFQEVMRGIGLQPPAFIEPGKRHRFPGVGKPPSNQEGYCFLCAHGKYGYFGDHSSGFREDWNVTREESVSRSESTTSTRRRRVGKLYTKQELKDRQEYVAGNAAMIWCEATPARFNHPYLIRHGIQPLAARMHEHQLLLPVVDSTGRVINLQYIAADGRMRLLSGGLKQGDFIPVAGDLVEATHAIICVSWATGCKLAAGYPGATVLAAIDAENLESVANYARDRWPTVELAIVDDGDPFRPRDLGVNKPPSTAGAASVPLALHPGPEDAPESLTDFDDLAVCLAGGVV